MKTYKWQNIFTIQKTELRPSYIFKLFLNFRKSEPQYSYKLYPYKKCVLVLK